MNRARLECQSHRLSVEDAPSVEYIARLIASIQQKFTARGGRRPIGICNVIAGYDVDGSPALYQTDPSGTFSSWKAVSTGRAGKACREYLEEKYKPDMDQDECIKLVVASMLDTVESGAKSIEVAVMSATNGLQSIETEKIAAVVEQIEKEKEEEAAQE